MTVYSCSKCGRGLSSMIDVCPCRFDASKVTPESLDHDPVHGHYRTTDHPAPKCERCGCTGITDWCRGCGHDSPAEKEQRARADLNVNAAQVLDDVAAERDKLKSELAEANARRISAEGLFKGANAKVCELLREKEAARDDMKGPK